MTAPSENMPLNLQGGRAAPRSPDLQTMVEELTRKIQRRQIAESVTRAELNEALAIVLMAVHPQRKSCAMLEQAWRVGMARLEQPFREELRRWADEYDAYSAG